MLEYSNRKTVDIINNKFEYVSKLFKKEITDEFNKNKNTLLNDLLSYENIYGKAEVESRIYFMKKMKLDFTELLENFKLIHKNI